MYAVRRVAGGGLFAGALALVLAAPWAGAALGQTLPSPSIDSLTASGGNITVDWSISGTPDSDHPATEICGKWVELNLDGTDKYAEMDYTCWGSPTTQLSDQADLVLGTSLTVRVQVRVQLTLKYPTADPSEQSSDSENIWLNNAAITSPSGSEGATGQRIEVPCEELPAGCPE